MRMSTVLNKMLGVQGLWVRDLRLRVEEKTLWLNVVPRWRISRCGSCGRKVRHRHDRSWRSWRHLDVFGWQTYLRYAIWRVKCPHCGVRTERVPWAPVGSRFTRDFEHQVAWLAQRCDLTAVAEYFRISWATVRNIVSRVIEQEWDPEGALDGLRIIGVDEISYRRHHRYLTVVVDHVSGRVVWAGKERKVKTLRRFLEGWLHRAMSSKLEPIKKVARMVRNHFDGVVGWVQWQISNGRLEGMNNRIRLLSHRSFGLHSAEALISLVYLCCGGVALDPFHTK